MAYCKTGPAIGPAGRGHTHGVECMTGPPPQPGVPFHTHALAGCCSNCDGGGTCESKLGEVEQTKNTLYFVAMAGAAIWLGFWWTKPKKRKNPRGDRWMKGAVKRPGAFRADVQRLYGRAGFNQDGTIKAGVRDYLAKHGSPIVKKRAVLARTFARSRR